LAVVLGIVVLASGVLVGLNLNERNAADSPTEAPSTSSVPEETTDPEAEAAALMEEAVATCAPDSDYVWLADEGTSIIAEGVGVGENPEGSIEEVSCVLTRLGAPESIYTHINTTSALDGWQEAEFGNYTAGWSFHPDSGIDMTIVFR
jgi:hypothetical protein